MTQQEFGDQLQTYENSILSLYRQKIQLVSQREESRFNYISVLKAKWKNLLESMLAVGYNQAVASASNPNVTSSNAGIVLTQSLMLAIQASIPMTDMTGALSDGWSTIPVGSPGTNNVFVNMLSPIENWISKPWNPPTSMDQRPFYQTDGASSYWQLPVSRIMDTSFMAPRLNFPQASFSLPLTMDWVKALTNGSTTSSVVDDGFAFAKNAFAQKFAIGSLDDLINEFSDTLQNIIAQTQSLLNLQISVDSSEQQLSDFVTSSPYGQGLDVKKILSDLQAQAKASPTAPTSAQAKSKLPWVLAIAAVVGLASMSGKKS